MQSGTRKHIALSMLLLVVFAIGGLWLGWLAPRATAAPLRASWPPSLTLTQIATGFTHPTYITHAGDGSGRIFIIEQPGRIRIVKNGVVQPTPFLDITSRVTAQDRSKVCSASRFHPALPARVISSLTIPT